jgi:hypothetical protein
MGRMKENVTKVVVTLRGRSVLTSDSGGTGFVPADNSMSQSSSRICRARTPRVAVTCHEPLDASLRSTTKHVSAGPVLAFQVAVQLDGVGWAAQSMEEGFLVSSKSEKCYWGSLGAAGPE